MDSAIHSEIFLANESRVWKSFENKKIKVVPLAIKAVAEIKG